MANFGGDWAVFDIMRFSAIEADERACWYTAHSIGAQVRTGRSPGIHRAFSAFFGYVASLSTPVTDFGTGTVPHFMIPPTVQTLHIGFVPSGACEGAIP